MVVLIRQIVAIAKTFIQVQVPSRQFLRLKMTSTTVTRRPPGVIQNWDLRLMTPVDLEATCDRTIKLIQDYANQTASAATLSYDNVLKPILEAYRVCGEEGTIGSVSNFPRYVADAEELRTASTKALALLKNAFTEMEMRKDVFDNLVKYRDEKFAEKDGLSPEKFRALDRLILNGRRNGLQLDQEVRDKVKELTQKLTSLEIQFAKNLADENVTLLFERDQLLGLDDVFIDSLDKDAGTGKHILTLKYPHYLPAMKKCVVPETRRRLEEAYNSRCITKNTEIMEEAVKLRETKASLLGYPNFATYAQEILMAENPTKVNSFLVDLTEKIKPLWEKEKAYFLELKKEECETYKVPFDGKINMWDFGHYQDLSTERLYSVNHEKLKEYFPTPIVTAGLLTVYQELLGLNFLLLPDAEKWNDDVEMYQVNDKETGELMGYFYLDLFPRNGKYGHACCEIMQQGCLDENGVKLPTIAVMICNFPRAMGDQPSLLTHDDVETFFHEFGHCMHAICSRAETAIFFGFAVSTDFVEAPSQMLENWVWEKEALRKMSQHYKTKEPIPDELLDNLLRSRMGNTGAHNLRQVVYALIDQRIHLPDRHELSKMYSEVMKEVLGMDTSPGTNSLAGFAHICGSNYEARYYSYLWSEVYSMDMYDTVFKKMGFLNPEAGKLYRKCILEPGGSEDSMVLLKRFLNKEPSNAAFLKSKGL